MWTNSIAILTDALHDLGDCISIGVAWWLQKKSRQRSDAKFTYGYRPLSVLGALITGIVLLVGLVFVIWKASLRLVTPEPVNAPGMMLFAVVGILFNGAAVLQTRRGTSLNEKVVSWHLLEDTLGWIAVLIGSAAMTLWNVPVIDPILSIGISLFVLWNVIRNLRKVMRVLLQSALKGFDVRRFKKTIEALPKVRLTHHTHAWSLDGEKHVLTTHVVVTPDATRAELLAIKARVRELLDPEAFEHVTVDVEFEGEPCLADITHEVNR